MTAIFFFLVIHNEKHFAFNFILQPMRMPGQVLLRFLFLFGELTSAKKLVNSRLLHE